MTEKEAAQLFNCLHPNFFESEEIRNLPAEYIFDEMILPLNEFDARKYEKKFNDDVKFGFYDGDIGELKKAVEKVEKDWAQFFNENDRIFCGFVNGKIASFCIIADMGSPEINGRKLKIGGPGCVGTLPEYREKGIGLTMVKLATQILENENYDYSYIHYTYVARWYEKLGYKTFVKWNKNGFVRIFE